MNHIYVQIEKERGWKCEVCGDAHAEGSHNFPRGKFPKLINDPENITVLCRKHHMDWEASRLWEMSPSVMNRAIKYVLIAEGTDSFNGLWAYLTAKLYRAQDLSKKLNIVLPDFLKDILREWEILEE